MNEDKTLSSTASDKKGIQVTLEGEEADMDWNFAGADTSYMTHGMHEYPARMIPQIAARLIKLYTKDSAKILDPFCGSGTTLVEARLAHRHAVGVDINPLAVLLAKVKSTPIDFDAIGFDVASFISDLELDYYELKRNRQLPDPPTHILPNLLHWFKPYVASELEFLYNKINEEQNDDLRDFLKVVFSDTVFACSNIDRRSSRFIRVLKRSELEKFNPSVIETFKKRLLQAVSRMTQYTRRVKEVDLDLESEARIGDARNLDFPPSSFDSIITSPPYGEEKNTIGYGRWAKLSLAWLRLNTINSERLQKSALGASRSKKPEDEIEELPSPTAVNVLMKVHEKDKDRVKDALPFFFDYLQTLSEMYRVLKNGGHLCIVIGNRSIRGMTLNMERVTVELATEAGFFHAKSYFRDIPTKLIPWTTPTGKTISRENIIILCKR